MPRQKPTRSLLNGETPLYVSLVKLLTQAIVDGKHPVGTLLPTETELAQTYKVSRQTVREALRRLDAQGLVSRHRGIGTRVQGADPQRRFTLSIDSLTDIVDYAKRVRLEVDEIIHVEASARLAAYIGCRERSRWIEIRGRRFPAQGPHEPVAVVRMHIRDDFAGIESRLRRIGGTAVHAMLEQHYGEPIEEIRQIITAIAIEPADAALLKVAPLSPGLKINRHFLGRGGRVVLVGHVVYPGETFSYSGNFRRDHSGREDALG